MNKIIYRNASADDARKIIEIAMKHDMDVVIRCCPTAYDTYSPDRSVVHSIATNIASDSLMYSPLYSLC